MKKFFDNILKKNQIVTKNIEKYNIDWMKKYNGKANTVLLPKNTKDVSNIMKICNTNNIKVHVQGGNTGLVGGSIAQDSEVLISMEKLNNIKNFCNINGIIHCESGSILQELDEYVSKSNWQMPLDLGAKGSCQIGGNIATNAGGLRVYKYGLLHNNIIGMKVVLPNGDIYNDTQGFIKNNTGYNLKNLMIGSEGTLGIITECQLKLYKKRSSTKVLLLSLEKFDSLLKLIDLTKNNIDDFVSAFELIDRRCMILHQKHNNQLPITMDNYNVLIETQSFDEDYHNNVLEDFFNKCMELDLINDGIVSNNETQLKNIWNIRENITEHLSKENKHLYKYDISIKLSDLEILRRKLNSYETFIFGHILDENIHLNILENNHIIPNKNSNISDIVYSIVNELNGSISAEHGIGFSKKKYLKQYDIKNQNKLLKDVKKCFDPNNILNSGVLIS